MFLIFIYKINELCAANAGASAKLYSAPGYLPPQPQPPPTIPCQGNNRVCVPQYQCSGGYVDASQVRGSNSQVIKSITIKIIEFSLDAID